MNILAMNIRIQKKLDDIKHILIKVYDYSSEEAYKYTDHLIEEYKSEAIQLPIPNNIYISNKLDERIKDLQTGTDFGVNISKMSMRLEEIVKKLEDEWKRNGIGGDEMDNTVSSKINPNYKMHVLVKYECLECDKSFILSKKYVDDLKGIDVSCPYWDSYNVEDTVIMDDPEELEALGCMGIGHVEEWKLESISISGIGEIKQSEVTQLDITRELLSSQVNVALSLTDGTYISTNNRIRDIQVKFTNGETMSIEKYSKIS